MIVRDIPYTKYFKAYLKTNNKKIGDEIKMIDFIEWIQNKHTEFRKLKNIKDRPYSEDEQKEFNNFIGR